MKVLLSSAYFGPVQWYQKLNRSEVTLIEQYDSYMKQTYRNRCIIATTNGIQALTIPTERSDSQSVLADNKTLMKDIRISDHGNWRHLHWNALTSAYGESPFFEYYADDIHPFFEKKWEYLYDFNMEITNKMCELIDLRPNIATTKEFIKSPEGFTDFRDVIRPKRPLQDNDFEPKRYYQVYESKHGFLPNLSILDLLFNMGPESIFLL
ncbi:WbqC family protein [Xylanibacter oryzae]|uniref:WbqC family protein n=1 Tax=Xylanibacter oryzae TaxID=185293 RepID=UPI000566CF10|nr:WbqC family protein [Xylanibacter oryzae]